MGNIYFEHKYTISQSGSSSPVSLPESPQQAGETPQILLWPSHRAFAVEARADPDVDLEKPKAIFIEVFAGENEVQDASLILRPGSAGLRLLTAEASLSYGKCTGLDSSAPGVIKYSAIAKNTRIGIRVPVRLEIDLREIVVRSEATYRTSQDTFARADSHRIPIVLPLGVNVQDVFKEKALCSKFSISCSTSIPLRITNCQLRSSSAFSVSTPFVDFDDLTVFPKQPLSMVYHVTRNKGTNKSDLRRRKLRMLIQYRCLSEEVTGSARSALMEGLEKTEFAEYSKLLAAHLAHALSERSGATDLEHVGLLREVHIPAYAECDWNQVLRAASPRAHDSLSAWLQNWHRAHATITLPYDAAGADNPTVTAPLHRITIPVDVPSTPFLQTASLRLQLPQTPTSPPAVGDAVPAELVLRFTRAWSEPGSSTAVAGGERPVAFTYELDPPPDTWLVAGRRRARFTAREGEPARFTVLLLPQRPGWLILPGVDVHCAPDADGADSARMAEARPRRCQVDYVSQGEAVLVVPGRRGVGIRVETEDGADGWKAVRVEEETKA